jgi:hypothetical protein
VKEFTANRCPNSSRRAQLMTPDKRIVCRGVMVPATIRRKLFVERLSPAELAVRDGMSGDADGEFFAAPGMARILGISGPRDLVCGGKERATC